MYFEIEGSSVRLAGTMHRVPKGRPLAHWVNDAISWARVIYLEHDKEESDRCRNAPPGSQPIARRLLRSWPRIDLTFSNRQLVAHLAALRPFAVASDVLGTVPTDEGVELLAIARSKATHPPGPRLEYLETAVQSYVLADGVSDAVWDDALSWALDNPASFKKVLEMSYLAWVAGDFEEVDRMNTLHSRNCFAPIKHAVITARNRLWLPTIRYLAQSTGEPTLVLVGAAHLGGPDGLVAQLAAGGLRLTGLQSLTH
jgi:hypothetical protein